MTQYLPPNLLALFAPRDPISYLPPTDKLPWEKTSGTYHGVAEFVKQFENYEDTPEPTKVETRDERKDRKRKERAEQVAYKLEQDLALWDPSNDPNILGDAYKTLFVGRVNYDSSESKLRREFEMYGPIKRIKLVHDIKTGKPRGYAYIEYEHERDMHSAYKHADGRKIDGRRVLVDVERGRTVKGWRPRRLGGGLGSTRKGGPDVNSKYSGRDEPGKEARSRSRSPMRGGGGGGGGRDRDVERRPGRSRSRERPPRRPRSRSPREPRRRRSRSKDRRDKEREVAEPKKEDDKGERRRRRSRSRDNTNRNRSRDRKRRRSRSRGRRSRDRTRDPKKEPEDEDGQDTSMAPMVFDNPNYGEVAIKEEKHDTGYDAHALPPEIEEGEDAEYSGYKGEKGGVNGELEEGETGEYGGRREREEGETGGRRERGREREYNNGRSQEPLEEGEAD